MRSRSLAWPILASAVVACGGPVDLRVGPTGPPGGISGGGLQPAPSRILVGRWSRILFFTDAAGAVHASETVWEFRADGTAARTVTVNNLSEGFFDTVTAHAFWSVNGTTVTVTFTPPDSGSVQFSFRIEGSILTLDGRDFRRVG
ncbi:MAG: hypothetical protein ABR543_10675 [Gemmatimonadaceae bacterium]